MHDVTNLRDQNSHPFRAAKPSAIRNYASLPKYLSQRRTLAIRKSHFFSRAANLLRDQKQCFASEVFFSATNPSRSEIAFFFWRGEPPSRTEIMLRFRSIFLSDEPFAIRKSHFSSRGEPLRDQKLCFASEVFFSASNPSRSEKSQFFFRGDLPSRSEIMLRFRSTFCSDEPARQQKFMALRFRGLEPYSGSSPHPVSHPNCQ